MQRSAPGTPREKSNARARIGFVLYYPFQYYVYKNIFSHLAAEAEFIIDQYARFPSDIQQKLTVSMIALLEKESVPYRVLYREDYAYSKFLRRFFEKYDCLVSVWERGCMSIPATLHAKKVRVAYGAGKELTMVRPSGGMYDLTLAFGKRDAQWFSYYSPTEIIGNPKFDDWFNDTIPKSEIDRAASMGDPKKKTVLYLPTHSDLSSVDILAPQLRTLSSHYNVIAKLHYFMTQEEPARVEKLKTAGVHILTDDIDLLPLLKVADMVLSDNSSAIFDAILADKPLLVADFWDESFLDDAHKRPERMLRGTKGATTFSESIEQVIKQKGWVSTISHNESLVSRVAETIHDSEYFRGKRKEIREEIFAFHDGQCGSRGAHAIQQLRNETAPRSRPILYHAHEALKQRSGRLSYARERSLHQRLASYQDLLHEQIEAKEHKPFFSVLLYRDPQSTQLDLRRSLRSYIEQDFPHASFEVLVLGATREDVEIAMRGIQSWHTELPAITPVWTARQSTLGMLAASGVAQARGNIVLFAISAYIAPDSLLHDLYGAYKKNRDIGGAGGYETLARGAAPALSYGREKLWRLQEQLLLPHTDHAALLYGVTNQVLFQNPAGSLAVISYVKELTPHIPPSVRTRVELEWFLKTAVMYKAPLSFLPVCVERIAPLRLSEFISSAIEDGYWSRMTRIQSNTLAWRLLPRPGAAFAYGAYAIAVRGRFRDALAVWIAAVARSFGSSRAYVRSLLIRFLRVLKGGLRSLEEHERRDAAA